MAEELISSLQNPKVKKLLVLQQKSSERRKERLFVVEGLRELKHCVEAGFEIDTLFYCPNITESSDLCEIISQTSSFEKTEKRCNVVRVSPEVYEKIAYRGTTEGLIAEVRTMSLSLESLPLGENPLIMILESVEKPGNLGAILRSADAAHADAVIVCDPLTDLYNPNLIRSSIGAVFTVPCLTCTSEDCIAFLKQKDIRILTAQLQDSHLYYDTDMRRGTAIVMGTESTGLTNQWRMAADAHIRIPMMGRLDSLNVSVSAAILLFEAVRQRNS